MGPIMVRCPIPVTLAGLLGTVTIFALSGSASLASAHPVHQRGPHDEYDRENTNHRPGRVPKRVPKRVMDLATEIDRSGGPTTARDDLDEEEDRFAELQKLVAADPSAPSIALRDVRRQLQELSCGTGGRATENLLRDALLSVDRAWAAFSRGSPDLSHLRRAAYALRKAQIDLRSARKLGSPVAERVAKVQEALAGVVHRMASGILARAERASVRLGRLKAAKKRMDLGLAALERGDYVLAVNHMGGAMNLASNLAIFDVALFEENIKNALEGNTVGYALSIAWKGQLYQDGEFHGLARTAADPPSLSQSPTKEMHVVSVSKTLTTIVLLRLLEEKNLVPDSVVWPFLPSDWDLGSGVKTLTFRDFLTHESGFGQISAGNTYAELRTAIGTNVGTSSFCPKTNTDEGITGFCYNNGNFGLMRVLSAGLLGHDMADFFFIPDAWAAAFFLNEAHKLYESIDVTVNCNPQDDDQTIQYNFPDDGTASGYAEPDRRLQCGGIGWHVSSNELAGIMAFLRLTENLLSDQARGWMEDGFLGYMDPANYGWVGGDDGAYYMHGGDWFHGSGEAHACALAFPIQVQVGLVINSARGPGMDYQCLLVQNAFENAWVEN